MRGNGIREISTVLNTTRVHNSVTSIGLLGRGLSTARAFASVREVVGKGGKKALKDVPLHVRTLSGVTLSYRANMLFTNFIVYCLGLSDQHPSWITTDRSIASDRLRPRSPKDLQLILRIVTPALKALTAKASISGLQECVESLGGVGYMENEESQQINVSRLYCDANVLSFREGTTNVLGTDFVKIPKGQTGKNTLEALQAWIHHSLFEGKQKVECSFATEKDSIVERLRSFSAAIRETELEELVVDARKFMKALASIVTGALLLVGAERDSDPVSGGVFKRFAEAHRFREPCKRDLVAETAWDSKIVFNVNIISSAV